MDEGRGCREHPHILLQGPAQTAGVMVGWFLDLGALLKEDRGVGI